MLIYSHGVCGVDEVIGAGEGGGGRRRRPDHSMNAGRRIIFIVLLWTG